MEERKEFLSVKGEDETLLFSDKVIKIHKYSFSQKRIIVITSKKVYNFKFNKEKITYRWWVEIDQIKAVTKSISLNSKEFVVHWPKFYDLRFQSNKRDDFINSLKLGYIMLTKKDLPIYGVPNKDLKEFTAIEKDYEKSKNRLPFSKYLLKDENVMEKSKINRKSAELIIEEIDDKEWESNWDSKEFLDSDSSFLFDIGEDKDDEGRPLKRSSTIYSRDKSFNVALEDFRLVKKIGEGAFGTVFLVTLEDNDKIFAMKSIRKDKIIDYEQIESTKLEKTILMTSNHPFIVQMEYVFQTDIRLYFVMEYVKGGELFTHIIKKKRFDEESAKFIIAQIILVMGFLHSKDIIYRDLKPENVLIAADGYVKLIDFGLSRILHMNEMAMTFWGTPEYCSPEMIDEIGHDFKTDWWAVGSILYEMLVGIPPFYDKNRDKMFKKIRERQPKFPELKVHKFWLSEKAKDLILRLLEKDMDNRLGSNHDSTEILSHEFFDGINIDEIMDKKVKPPFTPEFDNDDLVDVSNFDEQYTQSEAKESIIEDDMRNRIINKAKAYFEDFDQIVDS